MEKCPPFRRAGAAALAVFYFLSQPVLGHAAESNVWAERHRASPSPVQLASTGGLTAPLPALQAVRPSIAPVVRRAPDLPADATRVFTALSETSGSLRRVALPAGRSRGLVVHIEDVHLNAEAQKNIAAAITGLASAGLGLIAVEGATVELPAAGLRAFPDRTAARDVLERRFRANRLSGPAYAALTAPSDIPLVGVDDAAAYRRNVRAYQDAARLQPETRGRIAREAAALETKKAAFNPALRSFDQAVTAYRQDRLPLGDFAAALASRLDAPPATISGFVAAVKLEKSIDFARASSERSSVLAALAPRLDAGATEALLSQAVAFRSGAVSGAEFYRHLARVCATAGVDLSRTPAFAAYLRYVILSDGIDAEALFRDLRASEDAVYAALARTPEERALIAASRLTFLAGRLVDFALTPEEWEEYKTLREDAPRAASLPAAFEAFYDEADVRDGRMAERTLAEIGARQTTTAVLVAGGFHTAGLRRILTAAGYTVVTFTPRLTQVNVADGTAYLGYFTRERTPIERLFQGRALFLAPPVLSPAETTAIASEMISGAVRRNAPRPPLLAWFNERLSKFTGVVMSAIDGAGARLQLAVTDVGSKALRRLNIGEPDADGVQRITVEDATGLGAVAALFTGGFALALLDPVKFFPAALALLSGAAFLLAYRVQNGRWPWSNDGGGFQFIPALAGAGPGFLTPSAPAVAPMVMMSMAEGTSGGETRHMAGRIGEVNPRKEAETRGMAYVEQLAADYGFLPADHPVTKFVTERLEAVLKPVPPELRPRVRVLARAGMNENAFVVADGSIVVTPEMVAYLDNIEELDGVLLHETNHWVDADFAVTEEAARNRSLLHNLGLGRYQEYKADMKGFFQGAEPERDTSPIGMISLAEKMRTLEKNLPGRPMWDLEHGSWDDRILNMKSMLQFIDMFNLERPMRPIDPAVRKAAAAITQGPRLEAATARPDSRYPDRWNRDLDANLRVADRALLSRILSAAADRLGTLYAVKGRSLYPNEQASRQMDEGALPRIVAAWRADFDRRHGGVPADERIALLALELEFYAKIPVISAPQSPLVQLTPALKDVAEQLKPRMLDAAFIPAVQRALGRLQAPVTREVLYGTVEAIIRKMVDFNSVFDRDSRAGAVMDVERAIPAIADLMVSAGQASSRIGYSLKTDAPTLSGAWTETLLRMVYLLMDMGQWRTAGKKVTAAVAAAQAAHPGLRAVFRADVSARLDSWGISGSVLNALKRYARKEWAPTDAVASDREMARLVRDIRKLKAGAITLEDPVGGPLLRALMDQLKRLPDTFEASDFPQTSKAADVQGSTFRSGLVIEIFQQINKKRRIATGAEFRTVLTMTRVLMASQAEFKFATEETTFFTEIATNVGMSIDELNRIADIMMEPSAAARDLGVTLELPTSRSDVRQVNSWKSAALAIVEAEQKRPATDDARWFSILDVYLRSWKLPDSRELPEDAPRKLSMLAEGLKRLKVGTAPLAAGDERKVLLLAFLVENPSVRLTVQESMLDRMLDSTNPIDLLDLCLRDYARQGSVGGLNMLTRIEDRLESVEDVRRFSEEGRKALEGSGSGDGLGMAVAAEGALDFGLRRMDRTPLLLSLLSSSRNDTALRAQIIDMWWELMGGEEFDADVIHDHDDNVKTEEDFDAWKAREIALPEATKKIIKVYPEGILRAAYASGIEARYALLRKLLVGENGVLLSRGDDFVAKMSAEFIDASADPVTAGLIEKILGAVFETADRDALYLLLYPLMLPRIALPPASDQGWTTAVREKARELASGMDSTVPDGMGEHERDVRPRDYEKMLATELRAKIQRLVEGKMPDLETAKETESALLSLAGDARRDTRAALSPLDFILESARGLGAPGVRFLQLLGQTFPMPESFRVSFLSVYDDMRGQSKSSALETITREMPEYAAQIKRFVRRLGGGSLFTVFEVELKDGTHEVVRVLNPNAMHHTEEALKTMRAAITLLAKRDDVYNQALPLLELLDQWIRQELQDPSFRADDAHFRGWDGFKPDGYTASVVVPESRWTLNGVPTESPKVRREQLMSGKNLTKLAEFDKPKQRELVSLAVKHYVGQIFSALDQGKIPGRTETTPDGAALVHSDVSAGNLRITDEGNLAILDRGMYLRITPDDAMFIVRMQSAGSPAEAVSAFIDRLAALDENKNVAPTLKRAELQTAILDRLTRRGADPEQAAIDMLVEVHAAKLIVPLKYTLLFKNINALNRLVKEAEPSWNLMDALAYNPSEPFTPKAAPAAKSDGPTPASLLYLLLTSKWIGLAPSWWVKLLGVAWAGVEGVALLTAFSLLPAALGAVVLAGFVAAHGMLRRASIFNFSVPAADRRISGAERRENRRLVSIDRNLSGVFFVAVAYFIAALGGGTLFYYALAAHLVYDTLWIGAFGPAAFFKLHGWDTASEVRRIELSLNALRGPALGPRSMEAYVTAQNEIYHTLAYINTDSRLKEETARAFFNAVPTFSPMARMFLELNVDPYLLTHEPGIFAFLRDGRPGNSTYTSRLITVATAYFSPGFDTEKFRRVVREDFGSAEEMVWSAIAASRRYRMWQDDRFWAITREAVATGHPELALDMIRTSGRPLDETRLPLLFDILDRVSVSDVPAVQELINAFPLEQVRLQARERIPVTRVLDFYNRAKDDPELFVIMQHLDRYLRAGYVMPVVAEALVPVVGYIFHDADPEIQYVMQNVWAGLRSGPYEAGYADAIATLRYQAVNARAPEMRRAAWLALSAAAQLDPSRELVFTGEVPFLVDQRLDDGILVGGLVVDAIRTARLRREAGLPSWTREDTLRVAGAVYARGLRLLSSEMTAEDLGYELGRLEGFFFWLTPLLPERPAFFEELERVLKLGAEFRAAQEAGQTRGPAADRLARARKDAGDAADVSAFVLKIRQGPLLLTAREEVNEAIAGRIALPAAPLPATLDPAGLLVLPQNWLRAQAFFESGGLVLRGLYRAMPAVMTGWYAAVVEFGRTFRPVKFIRDHAPATAADLLLRTAGVLFIYSAMVGAVLFTLSFGAAVDLPTWASALAAVPFAALSNIVAHGIFDTVVAVVTQRARVAPALDIATAIRERAAARPTALEAALPPVADRLLRKTDGRGLLANLSRREMALVRDQLEALGTVPGVSAAAAQGALKEAVLGDAALVDVADLGGKAVALAVDAGDVAAAKALVDHLDGKKTLYLLVSEADRADFAAMEGPKVRLITADGAVRRSGASRTLYLSAVASALATLSDEERADLVLGIKDADVVDKTGLTAAQERVLAPVRLAVLEALNAIPITRVQLDAVIDLAKLVSVQA